MDDPVFQEELEQLGKNLTVYLMDSAMVYLSENLHQVTFFRENPDSKRAIINTLNLLRNKLHGGIVSKEKGGSDTTPQFNEIIESER